MSPEVKRPFIVLLASHWLSMLGVALTTTAGFSWLFVLPQHMQGNAGNPYIGILIFLMIPAILFVGLALIPIGILLARRKIVSGLTAIPDRRAAWRRLGTFLGLMTFVNLVIGSQATYRAVTHMETDQFCGQSCHVMKPEFTAWQRSPHSRVECVNCHIVPGAAGWFASKFAGTRQLVAVVLDDYHRPVESAIESNRLVSSVETCERCHARGREVGQVLKVVTSYGDDEQNKRTQTVLMMQVGGRLSGIHGAHMGPGIEIRYAAADAKRDSIPVIEYRGPDGKTKTFVDSTAKGNFDALPRYTMQCADCHNRPGHPFQLPGRAVDRAMEDRRLPRNVPFIHKASVAALTESKSADDVPVKLAAFYKAQNRSVDLSAASKALVDIFNDNVFPDLKVTWGTYSNNLGHTDSPGCFRCHDGNHTVKGGSDAVTQDCSACHNMVAVDEATPEVLKTLGIDK
ncbi:MAG: NapC/NirT family cytochrome c [Acidobacteriota bacterium]|nr:NapC/NirT family cytochrome c [Acidobacteriota bacterium]